MRALTVSRVRERFALMGVMQTGITRKFDWLILSVLALWLLGWVAFAWPAVQDDALIHLRYADNLYLHHTVSYNVLEPGYGASSLLYIGLLAVLRALFASPNLAHATSAAIHLLLFAGVTALFWIHLSRASHLVRLLGFILLGLLVVPSAVRWLDDGMETGLVLCATGLVCVLVFHETRTDSRSAPAYLALVVLGFFTVLLRTELLLLCAGCCLMLTLRRSQAAASRLSARSLSAAAIRSSHLFVGGLLACGSILWRMRTLLPDTAIAKSLGPGYGEKVLVETAFTLGGAFSFGLGMLLFWLLTLIVLLQRGRRITPSALIANLFFPTVLLFSALRGQMIQGVRYFCWTLFFAALWNILELSLLPATTPRRSRSDLLIYAFLVLLALDLPVETVIMHRVLERRVGTVRRFEAQHLEQLRDEYGVATDIGYIGYFTQARLCDLAGLVNGRAAARLDRVARAQACVATQPDFLFGSAGQLGALADLLDLSDWQICGRYDLVNVRTLDAHYLIAPPRLTAKTCLATGNQPVPLTSLLR
jgi:hypothetical protein